MDINKYAEHIQAIKNQLQKAIDELCETTDIIAAELENINGTNISIPEETYNKAVRWETYEVKNISQSINNLHNDIANTITHIQEVNFAKYSENIKKISEGRYAVNLDENDTNEMKHRAALMLGSAEEKVSFKENPFVIVKDNNGDGKLYAAMLNGTIPLPLNSIEKYDAGTITYIEDRRILAREQEANRAANKHITNEER